MKKYIKNILTLFILLSICCTSFFFSCSKDDSNSVNGEGFPNQVNLAYDVEIDFNVVHLSFDPSLLADVPGDLSMTWSSSSDFINIENVSIPKTSFTYLDSEEEKEVIITLSVTKGVFSNFVKRTIILPKRISIRDIGLGEVLQAEKSNNVPHRWYVDQGNTGQYSSVNCGPSSVTMAIKWANDSFSGTAEHARSTYRSTGGWWYTTDIISYLNLYNVSNYVTPLRHISSIKQPIDEGCIVILCLDMFYIRDEQNSIYHVDKFYHTSSKDWGHFIVVKGYKAVDNETFYELYDPYSNNQKYVDGSLKGKDRYYREHDLDEATQQWWNYAIVIQKGALRSSLNKHQGVDPSRIEHKYGGVEIN